MSQITAGAERQRLTRGASDRRRSSISLKHDGATNKMEEDIVPLDATQADDVTQSQLQASALQASIEACKENGLLKRVQTMELEISQLRRRERTLSSETPVVAEAFKRQRLAEEQ